MFCKKKKKKKGKKRYFYLLSFIQILPLPFLPSKSTDQKSILPIIYFISVLLSGSVKYFASQFHFFFFACKFVHPMHNPLHKQNT